MGIAAQGIIPLDITDCFETGPRQPMPPADGLYYLGEREQSATAFEKVEARLPLRTLWYQIEPIQNYFDLGGYLAGSFKSIF